MGTLQRIDSAAVLLRVLNVSARLQFASAASDAPDHRADIPAPRHPQHAAGDDDSNVTMAAGLRGINSGSHSGSGASALGKRHTRDPAPSLGLVPAPDSDSLWEHRQRTQEQAWILMPRRHLFPRQIIRKAPGEGVTMAGYYSVILQSGKYRCAGCGGTLWTDSSAFSPLRFMQCADATCADIVNGR